MNGVAAEHELFHACRIIFGPELDISREFLEYLQLAGVKTAFRKKAMEVHPDRMKGKGELARKQSARMFHSVRMAYEKLTHYVDAREKGFRFSGPCPPVPVNFKGSHRSGREKSPWGNRTVRNKEYARTARAWRAKARAAHFHHFKRGQHNFFAKERLRRVLPERPLLFGHFLYYAGLASWQNIVKALLWQRAQRPRLGEIAVEKGWMQREDVFPILKAGPQNSLPFGQQAVRQGLLTKAQVYVLLARQKSQHKKFGEFFVMHKIFTPQQLSMLLIHFHRHNARFSRPEHAGKK